MHPVLNFNKEIVKQRNLLNKKYNIYSEAVSMTVTEVITRRQPGHLNKIKMKESDDPW